MTLKKILIADDSPTALLAARMVLRGHAYQIVTATNGREAVVRAVVERPDLILLDVVMPELNGFEACRQIRLQPALAGVPVIMVTTRGEEPNVETAFRSGCTDYITKPINGAELLTKIRSCLEQ